MANLTLVEASEYTNMLDLLRQAEMIIRPEPKKIVYRTARAAWAKQYDQLMKEKANGHTKP